MKNNIFHLTSYILHHNRLTKQLADLTEDKKKLQQTIDTLLKHI